MNKNFYDLYKEQLETPWDKPWIHQTEPKGDYTEQLQSMLSMPDGEILITVVGLANYSGNEPFEIGKNVHLVKETGNRFDSNAIMVFCDNVGKCGYVANSTATVKQGTLCADIIHGGIGDSCLAEVMWIDDTFVICRLCGIDNYRFVFNHAVDYCYAESYNTALNLFLSLEKICETVDLLQRICDCYIKLKRLHTALEYAERALALDADNKRTQLMKRVIIENLRGNENVQL